MATPRVCLSPLRSKAARSWWERRSRTPAAPRSSLRGRWRAASARAMRVSNGRLVSAAKGLMAAGGVGSRCATKERNGEPQIARATAVAARTEVAATVRYERSRERVVERDRRKVAVHAARARRMRGPVMDAEGALCMLRAWAAWVVRAAWATSGSIDAETAGAGVGAAALGEGIVGSGSDGDSSLAGTDRGRTRTCA